MRVVKPRYVVVFLLGLIASELSLMAYTFTSVDGRTLEADIISRSESTVTVRRDSDGRVFKLNLDRLISEDILSVQAWSDESSNSNNGVDPYGDDDQKPEIGEWPRRLKPENYDIEVVREDSSAHAYIYQTPHFEFHSNVKLARKVVRQFSQIFESTLLALNSLPLELSPKVPDDGFFQTQIFETEGQYVAAGGMPNSAGAYFRKSRKIKIPLRHLGVKKTSSSFTIDDSREINVLAHEITHQLTHEWLSKWPVWVSEGIAEYIENAPYERGTFRFDKYEAESALHWVSPSLVRLEVLMAMDKGKWNKTLMENRRLAATNYQSAFVLFYYFCHLELDEDDKPRLLYDYLRAVEAGKSREVATQILLDGRSYEKLEESVKKAYKRAGIKLMFL